MTKMFVLYYSSYGHVETLAHAEAEGAGKIKGSEVTVKRVPKLVPEAVQKRAGYKTEQAAPVLTDVNELAIAHFQGKYVAQVAKKLHG